MNETTKNGPVVGPEADRGDIDRQDAASSRFKPLDSFRVNPHPRQGGPEGQTAETFSLSYSLDGTDHLVTFEANAADDVDVLTDGSSVFVIMTSFNREAITLAVVTDGEQTARVQLEGALTTKILGRDVWSLSPDELLVRLTRSAEQADGQPRDAAAHELEPPLAPDPETRLHLRDVLEEPQEPKLEVREVVEALREPAFEIRSEWEPIRAWTESAFTLALFDTQRTDRDGKPILAYQLVDQELGPEPVFAGADFHCSPLHAVDSDTTVASLLGFLSLRPGDTDRDHFDGYTARQLDWCQRRGEELSLLAYELALPYRPLRGAVIDHESWDEASCAGRHNRALTLAYSVEGQDHRVTLSSGESDSIEALTDGHDVYVVTSNSGLQYVGLEVFSGGAPAGDLFVSGSEVEECFGDDVWDLGTSELLERLLPYLPDSDSAALPPPAAPSTTERAQIAQRLEAIDSRDRERVQTFLRIGRENHWIAQASDPPFNERSFRICKDVDDLAASILRGNWCLGQAFMIGDICFINQVDGGDEWLAIKGSTAFESITMRTASENLDQADRRLRETVKRIQATSEAQCKSLKY